MPGLSDLLVEVDRQLAPPATRIPLRVIGATALALQTRFERGTKDGDVLETLEVRAVADDLRRLAGPDTVLAHKHGVYLDFVPPGYPFLPQSPTWNPLPDLNRKLRSLEVAVLDVVDVVVSKLKRFSASDVGDIAAMVALDLVPHDALVARFRSAVEIYVLDSRADQLPRYLANLNRVERDLLAAPETKLDLPSWI